jgi:hypothetical protein
MYRDWPSLAAPKLVSAIGIGGYKPPSKVMFALVLGAGFVWSVIDAPGGCAVAQAASANAGKTHEAFSIVRLL